MSADRWRQLRGCPELVEAVIASPKGELALQQELRKRFAAELVPLAFQLRDARRRAASRFSFALDLWADPLAVEQATSQAVAMHKAARFRRRCPGEHVFDLCCGLGSDAIAMLAADDSREVTAVDLRPEALLFTRWNAEAQGVAARLSPMLADVREQSWTGLVHLDPDRRPNGRRVRRLEEVCPPLPFLTETTRGTGGAIKISPASNFGGHFDDCEIELISSAGECREAVIWFGSLVEIPTMRATTLTDDGPVSIIGDPLDEVAEQSTLRSVLFDPDPAVVRAGLVDLLAVRSGLMRLDESEEYLTGTAGAKGSALPLAALLTPFEVVGRTTNNPKAIRRLLREHTIGPLEVKTRHVPVDANQLQRKYQAQDGEPGVLFILREQQKTVAVLARRPS